MMNGEITANFLEFIKMRHHLIERSESEKRLMVYPKPTFPRYVCARSYAYMGVESFSSWVLAFRKTKKWPILELPYIFALAVFLRLMFINDHEIWGFDQRTFIIPISILI